jgi:membrane-bound lytic murein transglycosylase D
MRISKPYLWMAALTALAFGNTACQTAQRSATLLPSGAATAPLLTQATSPAPVSEVKPAAPAPPAQTVAKPDPAAALIAQVEKEYQNGQDDYKAGHLDAAKDSFDRAFNLLLGSPLDVRSDQRLEQEFDRVLDGVNGLELQALQQGDGFSEQKSEPAPIDEANDTTVPVDPSVRAKAEAEIRATHSDLPLMMTDQVASYISHFSRPGTQRPLSRHDPPSPERGRRSSGLDLPRPG